MQEFIGKYQIIEEIGRGGYGVIYKALDPVIGRFVAIKYCHETDDEYKRRLYREARAAGRLNHPNIVTIYEFGEHEGRPYIVEEYLEGEDLSQKIHRKEKLSYYIKINYLVQVARGLAYAHKMGIVHRDIKPSNIRVLPSDSVKILDFGIARIIKGRVTAITKPGIAIGTAYYIAPEIIGGSSADHRSDIFSFGVVAYELLSYKLPFFADNVHILFYKIVSEPHVPLSKVIPACPQEIEEVIEKCLKKDPEERYRDTSELVADLEKILNKLTNRLKDSAGVTTTVVLRAKKVVKSPLKPKDSVDGETTPVNDVEFEVVESEHENNLSSQHDAEEVVETRVIETPKKIASERIDELPVKTFGYSRYMHSKDRVLTRNFLYIALGLVMVLVGISTWFSFTHYYPSFSEAVSIPSDDLGLSVEQNKIEGKDNLLDDEIPSGKLERPGGSEDNGNVSDSNVEGSKSVANREEDDVPTEGKESDVSSNGVLTLLPGWSKNVVARINGESYILKKPVKVDLKPDEYMVSFHLNINGFRYSKTVNLRIEEGEVKQLKPDLPYPARVTFLNLLGTPRGEIFLNGRVIGKSPIKSFAVPPGDYTLEIKGKDLLLKRNLSLKAGRRYIVSFDLVSQNVLVTLQS